MILLVSQPHVQKDKCKIVKEFVVEEKRLIVLVFAAELPHMMIQETAASQKILDALASVHLNQDLLGALRTTNAVNSLMRNV